MEEIHGIINFLHRDIAGAADVSAALFLLCPDVKKNGTFRRAAAVDFIVDIYSF